MDVYNTPQTRSRGFNLIELLTTLALTSVSLAILVPSWAAFAERSQITSVSNQLLNHLRYARNAAVTHNRMISLCPSDDGASCSGDPFGWQHGYLVFEDRDGNRDRSPGEALLRIQDPLQTSMRLHSTAGRPAIRFRPDGAAWSTNTSFSVCLGDDPAMYRAVILLGTGRARVDQRLPSGLPVTCS